MEAGGEPECRTRGQVCWFGDDGSDLESVELEDSQSSAE